MRDTQSAIDAPSRYWNLPGRPNFNVGTSPEQPLKVYLNHGRWIAECPHCNGAQIACQVDPRFLCNECGNVAVGGLWRSLEWPTDRPGIEAALEARPVKNQNWLPGETVDDLKAEVR